MEKLVILGIVVLVAVWYFKNKKSKSKDVKDTIQEEFTETCCSKSSEDKEEVKEDIKEEDKVEVSLEKYPAELAENLKISNLEVTIVNLPSIIEGRAPNDCTLDNLKELAKDIFSKQVEPLSYATIYKYIADHYQEDIRLNTLADMVGMTPVSFSRFFRLRTGKTLSDYIIDIRLGFATRLLVDSAHTIAEICYDCGFNNLSNFNRMFKRKKDCSPKEFRENYRKKKIVI